MSSDLMRIVKGALMTGAIVVLGSAGCEKKKGGGTGGGGGGAWLVGADGTMVQLLPDGTLGAGYPLETDDDLLGITCRGLDTAFVVGEGGTLLRTFDGGASWEAVDLGTAATLRDVAAARADVVYVAGDGGLWVSPDSGTSWQAVPGSARDWRSVASAPDGGAALAIATDGTVWRWDADVGVLAQVTFVAGARAVSLSHHGDHAVVVGDDGAMLRSATGGRTWEPVATGTAADLYGAWATVTGELLAIGADGTVVRAAAGGDVEVTRPGLGALRAIHLDAAGVGLIAGDGGEVLRTDDGGDSWSVVEVDLGGAAIYGLDAIEGEGHY